MKTSRIGCSGFQYKEWKEVFYPAGMPSTKWFEYYCTRFNCVELNSTFYSFPKLTTLEKWYNRSPEGFVFAVKAPQTITHYKRFNECEEIIKKFYSVLREGLKEKLGPVLFQLPPSTIYKEETLLKILNSLDNGFKNVIEFRHPSWWTNEVMEALKLNHITFAGVSHPKMPDQIIHNSNLLYYRLHGVPTMFKSEYSIEFIEKLLNDIKVTQAEEIYILFNNTWGIAGVVNALQMKSFLN